MLATRVRKVGKGRGKRWGRRAMYTGDRVRNERRKKDARGRWKRTARSRRSDKDRRHGSKSERGRKKGRRGERRGRKIVRDRMEKKEREREQKKIRSTCILFVTRLPEARNEGDSSGEEGATEVGLGSFHTKARIYDKGDPLTPWHLASKLTLLPTRVLRRRVFPSPWRTGIKLRWEGEGIRTLGARKGEGRRVPSSRRQARCKRKTRRLATFNESEWILRFRKGNKRVERVSTYRPSVIYSRGRGNARKVYRGREQIAHNTCVSRSWLYRVPLDVYPRCVYGRVRGLYTRSGVREAFLIAPVRLFVGT